MEKKRPERYGVPLLALYSGARLEEICQLEIRDVRKVGDIRCFDINDRGRQGGKGRCGKTPGSSASSAYRFRISEILGDHGTAGREETLPEPQKNTFHQPFAPPRQMFTRYRKVSHGHRKGREEGLPQFLAYLPPGL